jgi:hypothetical protein
VAAGKGATAGIAGSAGRQLHLLVSMPLNCPSLVLKVTSCMALPGLQAAERIAELTSCLEDAPTPAMLASLEQRLAAKTREAERLAAARSSSSGAISGSGGSSSGSGASASNSSGDGASAAAELDAAKRQVCVAWGCLLLSQPAGSAADGQMNVPVPTPAPHPFVAPSSTLSVAPPMSACRSSIC